MKFAGVLCSIILALTPALWGDNDVVSPVEEGQKRAMARLYGEKDSICGLDKSDCICSPGSSQNSKSSMNPGKLFAIKEDSELSKSIQKIVTDLGYDKDYKTYDSNSERISITVIDLSGDELRWGGLNPKDKSYPASASKVFVAAEIYRQAADGELSLDDNVLFDPENVVGNPIVKSSEKYPVKFYLARMMDYHDNSCANQCIDIAGRENISKLMVLLGITDSTFTRKFMPLKQEAEEYQDLPSALGTSFDYAYMYALIGKGIFISPEISDEFYQQLLKCTKRDKIPDALEGVAEVAHKPGEWGPHNVDAGIVKGDGKYYAIAIFFPELKHFSNAKIRGIVKKIHELM